MVGQRSSKEPVSRDARQYERPALTRFGTIEQWTLGAMDGISISIVI